MLRKFTVTSLSIILTLAVWLAPQTLPVHGMDAAPQMVSNQTLSVPAQIQEKTLWCWAACGSSVVRYLKNTSCTQTAFCIAGKGSNVNEAGQPDEVQAGLSHYGLTSTYSDSNLSVQSIKNEIDNGRPIIADLFQLIGGHANIINGYSYDDNQDPNSATIYFMEPSEKFLDKEFCKKWGATQHGVYYAMPYNEYYCNSTYYSLWNSTIYNIH